MANKRFKTVFIIFLTLLQSVALSAAPACSDLFRHTDAELTVHFEYLNDFKNEILKIDDLSVLMGLTKPNWNHYNHLKNILKTAEKLNQSRSSNKFTAEEIQNLKDTLQSWALPYHQATVDLKPTPELVKFIDENYGYFNLLSRINTIVGLNIFPTRHLELVPQKKELLKDAEKTVASNEKILNKLFSTTGHKSKSAYNKYVQEHSVKARKLLDLVQNNLVVAIHRPENARFWIPISGFQNQRTTGSSNGSMNPNHRNLVESNLTFQDTEEYSQKSVRYMPNYGEARPQNGYKSFSPNTGADHYGSDLWIVKKELYDKRATWTPRDSFGQSRVTGPEQATLWDQMFIPWTHRELMVPYALNTDHPYSYDSTPTPKVKPFSPTAVADTFKLQGNRYGSSYFEVQIWGPLTIDDIQALHFKSNPPDKELFDLLVSKGIEIWDERTWPAQKYNGAESK